MGTIIGYIMEYTLLRYMKVRAMGHVCGVYIWLACTQSFLEQ